MERRRAITSVAVGLTLLAALIWFARELSQREKRNEQRVTTEIIEKYYTVPENAVPAEIPRSTIESSYTIPEDTAPLEIDGGIIQDYYTIP